MKGGTLKFTRKIKAGIAAVGLTLGLGAGAVALTTTEASASYVFPGLSVIDTQGYGTSGISCDAMSDGHVNDGNAYCYTWIRTNGVLRRGSNAEYFSEAGGGYVLVACSQAYRVTPVGSTGPPFGDFWGSAQANVRWQWVSISNHGYCQSPVLGAGYNYTGYRWNQVVNANLQ
jgi:hypothetical protein